jgi:phage head maturation protease
VPWHIGTSEQCPSSKPHAVIKDSDGKVVGCHATQDGAKAQLAALYASEDRSMSELLLRDSALGEVDRKQRLIDVIAVPWEQEAEVPWRGEIWNEVFARSAFDGIEDHAGRIRVNREHVKGDTVGKVVQFDTGNEAGLLARVKIADTPRGDETLALAEEEMISPSVGYRIKSPSDVVLNKRTRMRRVVRAFLDHLGMVESPAYVGAQVLAVREEQSGLTVAETPLPETPVLDELMNDDVLAWAASRLTHSE